MLNKYSDKYKQAHLKPKILKLQIINSLSHVIRKVFFSPCCLYCSIFSRMNAKLFIYKQKEAFTIYVYPGKI
jgi:hypothetical protein